MVRNELPELTRHRVESIFDDLLMSGESAEDDYEEAVLHLTKRESQRRQQAR